MLPKPRPVSTHTETVASISVVNYNQAPSRHGSFGAVNDRPGSFGAVNEAGEGAFSRSAVRPRTPPAERLRKREKDLADEVSFLYKFSQIWSHNLDTFLGQKVEAG